MNHIRLLDSHTIEQLRAGEVIERPASIVKELVENAIDAGARSISVSITKGGIDEIVVQDDGSGLTPEDASLAFQRHATSKIQSSNDLFLLTTLGFRGEALASIAAVTQVELLSRTADAIEGVRVRAGGSTPLETSPAGCPQGTTVTTRHLFFNTPPRRAFLKSPTAEGHQVHEVLVALALSRPSIHFRFQSDGREVFQAPSQTELALRARAVIGKEWAQEFLPLPSADTTLAEEGVGLTGLVSPPGRTRNTRTGQYFFVNERPVKSQPLSSALSRGYGELLPAGRFPLGVLFLTVPTDQVDVNVHPTKREVKFQAERELLQMIVRTVRKTLDRANLFKKIELPASDPPRDQRRANSRSERLSRAESRALDSAVPRPDPADYPRPRRRHKAADSYGARSEPGLRMLDKPLVHEAEAAPLNPVSSQTTLWQRPDGTEFRVVGQSHELFVLVEVAGELWIVDQHAAHERIMYEQVLDSLQHQHSATQPVLIPETFDLSPAACSALEELHDYLVQVGFDIQPFGGNTFQVQATPAYFRPADTPALLSELAEAQAEGRSDNSIEAKQEDLAARIACKVKSIKAGQTLTPEAMHALVKTLLDCTSPFTCPHGRPTMVRYSVRQLERQFDRR